MSQGEEYRRKKDKGVKVCANHCIQVAVDRIIFNYHT